MGSADATPAPFDASSNDSSAGRAKSFELQTLRCCDIRGEAPALSGTRARKNNGFSWNLKALQTKRALRVTKVQRISRKNEPFPGPLSL
jgi:hypothetical protein